MAYINELNLQIATIIKKHIIACVIGTGNYFYPSELREALDAAVAKKLLSCDAAEKFTKQIIGLYHESNVDKCRIIIILARLLIDNEINTFIGRELADMNIDDIKQAITRYQLSNLNK